MDDSATPKRGTVPIEDDYVPPEEPRKRRSNPSAPRGWSKAGRAMGIKSNLPPQGSCFFCGVPLPRHNECDDCGDQLM